MSSLLDAAIWWISQGVDLVPVQPGSKRLVPGFGAYRRRIQDESASRFWFSERRAGLAVVCGSGLDPGLVVLDFDDPDLYRRWQAAAGSVSQSYTVATRRGFHVHLWGDAVGIVGGEGLDVLGPGRVAVSSPSAGYRDCDSSRHIVRVKALAALPLLSKKKAGLVSSPSSGAAMGDDADLISAIKAAFSVHDLAEDAGIKLRSSDRGRGRWWVGLCPFHDDHHPSLWLDAHRGLWGCRACGFTGDVINLYARLNRTNVQTAIGELAAQLRGCNA